MLVSKFYRQNSCETLSKLDSLSQEDSRHLVLLNAISDMCEQLKGGVSHEEIHRSMLDKLSGSYKEDWFSFSWEKEHTVTNDAFCIKRFLDWIGTDFTVLETNCAVGVPVHTVLSDGSKELSVKVPLIVQFKNGRYGAVLLFAKCADKSVKGKSVHTAIGTDLYAMVAKAALEEKYPGICISSVYLRNEDDTDESMLPALRVNDTRKSNVFSQTFSSYYENNVFQKDFFLEVLENVMAQPFEPPCFNCQKKYLCKVTSVQKTTAKVESKADYVLPDYSESQKQVISHTNGPMLVCAGPGSGKTATLVGRIKRLIDDGVPPEIILVITFTDKAAGELRARCASFCKEGESPKIATLNALGYEILLSNKEFFPHEVQLLSPCEQVKLVKALISITPQLIGFNYGVKTGRNSLYKVICSKLQKYFSAESDEAFFQKEPKLGTDFVRFAKTYKEIVDERGYISFDEQISLCNKLFEAHEEIRKSYECLYRYIMVDEYQDINAEQAKFIYNIGKHENLVVVGDDDQAVYGFRGASNFFMLNFPKEFPSAKTIVLNENFRSTQSLVNAAQSLISNNKQRIEKDIHCSRENGMSPVLVPDTSITSIESVVAECIRAGYSYGDIAILSTKNAPLEKLYGNLSFPCILAKTYLRQDPLFLYVYDVLKLYDDLDNDAIFYHYLQLSGIDIVPNKGLSLYQTVLAQGYSDVRDYDRYAAYRNDDSIYSALRILSNVFSLLSEDISSSSLLSCVEYHVGLEDTISSEAVENLVEKNKLQTPPKLKEYMEYMLEFEDETRVELGPVDSVLLVTSHESKGMEFSVVLMFNDYSENSEEMRRLFYVAMTRAKDRLYILHDASCKNAFLNEFSNKEVVHE